MEIGTYIEKSVDHELSGNIIDLCPVGALNNKPYRFSARAWEMIAKPLVGAHDCAGSNLFAHVSARQAAARRAARQRCNQRELDLRPRPLQLPRHLQRRPPTRAAREDERRVGATRVVAGRARDARPRLLERGRARGRRLDRHARRSPSATLEELYLLNRITRHLGSDNIDTRLRRRDFRDQAADPVAPSLGCSIADLDTQHGVARDRLEPEDGGADRRAPVRKAARKGASVAFVNPEPTSTTSRRPRTSTAPLESFVAQLAGVVAAAAASGRSRPSRRTCESSSTRAQRDGRAASGGRRRSRASRALVLLGQIAQRHPRYSDVRALAAALADLTGATLGYLSEGANAVGAALAGALPHRGAGGEPLVARRAATRRRDDRRRRARPTCCSASSRAKTSLTVRECARRAACREGRVLHAVRRAPSSSTSPMCCCRSARSPRRRARS